MKIFTLSLVVAVFGFFSLQVSAQSSGFQNGATGFQKASLSEKAPGKQSNNLCGAKSYPWTLQFNHNIDSLATGQAGIESDGTYFYTPVWSNDTIYKFNMSGVLVEKFVISGVSGLRDLAYDGTYFYGGASSNTIYKMNFTTKTLVSTITAPSGVQARHICYDPVNNALWCGNWTTDLWLVSATNGTILDTIPALGNGIAGSYGSAYDTISPGGPFIWLFDQSGNGVNIYQVNATTEQLTGLVYDVSNDMTLANGALAGGLFIEPNLVTGTVTLGGLVQNNMIFGYNLASTVPDTIDIGVYKVLNPSTGYNKSSAESVKIIVKNYGSTAISSYSIGYKVNGGTAVTQSVSNSLASFAVDTITFTTTTNMSNLGIYNFQFFTTLSTDNNHNNDTLSAAIENLSPASTFPYSESFETGFGGWVQSSNDILDWTRYTGSTPSSGTGPTAAADGSYYVYVEMSGPSTGDSALMTMPFNVSNLTSPYFKFNYHMYGGTGAAMGGLYINIFDGTTTTYNVWNAIGNQGTNWLTDSIDLSSYTSGTYTEIQFVAVRGTSYASDIAVDKVELFDTYVAPPPTIPNLVITEINYNNPGSDTLEFVEIYNNGSTTVNLGGLNFVQGVTYTFPPVSLAAGAYFVVAGDSVKVNNFFNISAYQWTGGGLSNGGEDICIVTTNGDTVDYVDYDDYTPWPTEPDGNGPSLTFCNVALDNNVAANWSIATTFAGVNVAGDSIWANPGAGCGTTPPPQTAFKVLRVDDDNNGSHDTWAMDTALTHSGYTYSTLDLTTVPTYNDLKDYDLIIWSTSNDGTSLKLWDVSDTATGGPGAIKFNAALTTYLDSAKGTVWVDGVDFLYDIYGGAPYNFNSGDFCYDVMGIDKYVAQTHVDDNLGSFTGLEMAYKSATNTINSIDTLKWKWSSLWYADALDITSSAAPLYQMGPANYDFAGKVVALYKGDVITSSLRFGSLGDGNGNYVQADVDSLIISMIKGVENGLPAPPPVGGDTIPPTVTFAKAMSATSIVVSFSEPVGASAVATANYTGLGTVSSAVNNAAGDEVTLTLASALNDGDAYILTVSNVKDTSNNMMASQMMPILWNSSNADIIYSEIMYNDLSSSDSLEYFEIYNFGTTTAHIGGYKVTEGIVYEFPAGTTIDAGKYLVIAKDSALVNSVFNITGTHQWVSGGLKNSGEDIAIENTVGDTVAYIDYDDSSPWPDKADGDGPSMVFCNVNLDNNDGANWSLATNFVTTFNGDSIFGDPGTGCIPIGFGTPEMNDEFVVYPNPAHNAINISSNGKEYLVRIYNISGSLVKELKINNTSTKVSLDNLNSGMYYIQFTNLKTGQQANKKLIIE